MAPTPGRSSIGVRVRPNANDFIKDLERQLAGKKKTFYVNVRANVSPATKDVQEWARTRLKAIPATVNVGANTSPATRDMQAWRATQRNIKTNVPIGVDTTKALTDLLAFRKIAGKDVTVNLKVNSESAAKAAERFQQALNRRGIDIPIDVNDAQMRRTASKIDTNLIQRLKSQGGVILDVDADTSSADQSIRQFSARAPRVETQLDLDLKQARLELARLRITEKARKLEMQVDVKRGGLDTVTSTIGEIEKRLGNFNFIRSLDFGPINLGKPGGLVGTLTTVTALAGALPALVTGASAAAQALTSLAAAGSLLPGVLGGVMATIGTFSVGISGMSDAFDALQTMWTETPAQAASASRRSVQAHNQLRRAVREEATAQREVASARREATNDLRNLNNELRGSVLNEAQAILDLQRARDRLAQGGFETSTDLKQAQLDEAKAVDNLINVRERNGQLQQKVNDANKEGVEGSEKVQSALERQTRASEDAAHALEAIATTQATSALGKFQQELDQLTPNARDFVMTIAGMKGEFEGLRNSVQERMFADTGPALRELINGLLPTIGPGMNRIADALNKNILQVFDTLGSSDGVDIIDRILTGTADALDKMPALIDPLIRGLGVLTAAGAEHLPQMVELFTRLADRFADFVEGADKSGKLDEFLDRGVKALGDLIELGVNLTQIVFNLGEAFGGDVLASLVNLTQKFEDWLGSAEGQKKINEYIEQAKQVWEDWKPVLEDLPGIFEQVSEAARNVLGPVLNVLDKVTGFLADNPALVEGFITAWLSTKILVGAASPLIVFGQLLAKIVSAAKFLTGWRMPNIPGLPGAGGALPGPGGGRPPGGGPSPIAVGGATVAAAGTLAITDIVERFRFASDAEGKYNTWKDARSKLATEDERRQLDKEAYAAIGVDIGNETIYPLPPAQAFKGMYQGFDPNAGAQFRAHDGKIWYGDKPVSDAWDKVSFFDGGYTDWGVRRGKMAELHGGEYVEPHDVVKHYGVEAMKAIHEKRVPKEFLGSYFPGGFVPPPLQPIGTGPLPGPAPTPPVQHGPPAAGATPVNPTAVPGLHGTVGPAPGPPTNSDPLYAPMDQSQYGPMGPTSGGGTDTSQQKMNIFGLEIPIGGQADPTRGWGPGGPPVGLGGGDGFDMRRFGIGPGPVGSGPQDWMNFAGGQLGTFLTGAVSTLGRGLLGAFGLEGILGSPYFAGATGLLSHFLNPDQTGVGVQAPGAGATNAAVDSSLNTYYNMPMNPVSGAPGTMPQVWATTEEAHGVAAGSEISYGGEGFPPWVYQIADQYGVEASTYGGHQEGRGVNQGIDWRPKGYAVNSPEGAAVMDRFAQALQSAPGVEQIIWENPITGARQGKDPGDRGADQTIDDYYRDDWSGHRDHVHTRHAQGLMVVQDPNGNPMLVPQAPGGGGVSIPLSGNAATDTINSLDSALNNGPLPSSTSYTPTPSKSASGAGSLSSFYSQWYPNTGAASNGPINYGGTTNQDPYGPFTNPQNSLQTSLTGPMGVDKTGYTENLKRYAKQLYLSAGMPPAEWPAFDRLIQKESSWDPTAKNPNSTAYGLGQFLDTTDAQYGPRTDNPFVQLPRIFQYIRDRYEGSPAQALQFHNKNNWYDRGGWLMPGQSTVDNATGKPELVVPYDQIPSFMYGGQMPTGAVPMPPRKPLPRPPDAKQIVPKPSPGPNGQVKPAMPTPAPQQPPVATPPPAITGVTAPPPAPPIGVGAPPGPVQPTPAPTVTPAQIGTGPGVEGATQSHLHPAVSKGINSAASTIGSLANTAVAIAAMGATAGAGGGAGAPAAGAAGAAAGGAGGLSVGGMIQQGGKIIEDIANVGASFLVGTLTNGTTENPYGVTQRGSNPTGGTRIVDNSTKYGDVYTQDQDEWFRRLDLREAQKAQANLGGYDRYA